MKTEGKKCNCMDRRRFVNLFGKTIAASTTILNCNSNKNVNSDTIPSKEIPPPNINLPKSNPTEKLTIKWSDFEFLGAFLPPTCATYNYTSSGLTHRIINDKLYLLGRSTRDKYVLFEPLSDEELSKIFPFPNQKNMIVYGADMMHPYKDIHSFPQERWIDAPFSKEETPVIGFTWHQDVNRLYWAHQHNYCNDYNIFPCLGASSMPESKSKGRVLGIWKVSDGSQTQRNRFVCQTCQIPNEWADKYVGGRRLLVGFGWNGYGNQSIASNGGTFGPTFGAVFHPDVDNDTNYSMVHNGMVIINTHEHGSAPGFDDCPPYYDLDEILNKPSRSVKWTSSSGHSYGVWIDTPDKHGILVPSTHPSSDFVTTIASNPAPTLRTIAVTNPEVLPHWLPGYNLQITDPGISRKIQARKVDSVSGNVISFSTDMVQVPPIGAYVFGGISYPNGVGGFVLTASVNRMNIYNPDELGENVLSRAPAHRQTTPHEYCSVVYPGIADPRPISSTGYCTGLTFDARNRRLYLQLINESWGLGCETAICVYKLH